MIYSKDKIIEEIQKGNIIYIPFKEENIKNQSIDVTIGKEIYIPDTKQWIDISKGYKIPKHTFFLAYTEEFIGTTPNSKIHPEFHQRSTLGRQGLFHTKAGWGDVGFYNRWAMEYYTLQDIELKAGDRVAQISFNEATESKGYSKETGNYQQDKDIDTIIFNWKKEDILPKINNK